MLSGREIEGGGGVADPADLEAQDRLEHALLRVQGGIDVQLVEHLGRDPAGAGLVAREGLAVHHHHVETGVAQLPG